MALVSCPNSGRSSCPPGLAIATGYGPDGKLAEVADEPFLGVWQLRSLAYDEELGESRVVCVLAADGKRVTATIDASDFPKLRGNATRTKAWNGSDHYHDMAVQASVLIEEQILTKDPEQVPSLVRIQVPAKRR